VSDLTLQIGQVDHVAVDDRDLTNAGTAEEERDRRAEAAGADDQGMCGEQAALSLDADVVEKQMSRIPQKVVVGHRRTVGAEK